MTFPIPPVSRRRAHLSPAHLPSAAPARPRAYSPRRHGVQRAPAKQGGQTRPRGEGDNPGKGHGGLPGRRQQRRRRGRLVLVRDAPLGLAAGALRTQEPAPPGRHLHAAAAHRPGGGQRADRGRAARGATERPARAHLALLRFNLQESLRRFEKHWQDELDKCGKVRHPQRPPTDRDREGRGAQ